LCAIGVTFVLMSITVAVYIQTLNRRSAELGGVDESPKRAHSMQVDDGATQQDPSSNVRRRATIEIGTAHARTLTWRIDDSAETMSSFAFIVNMFADLCPPGVLPLAYGLQATGFVPGAVVLVAFATACVYTFWTVGETTELTGERTFGLQWSKAIGQSTAWVPVAVVMAVCFGNELAYACFYADIFTSVVPAFRLNLPRWVCLVAITLFPTLPLCLVKDLSALAYSSFFALVAVSYTVVAMVWRMCDGTYAPGGRFYADLEATMRPVVPSDHLFDFGMGSLVLVNSLGVAFLSHYNACKYYRELERQSPTRLRHCTMTAMGLSAAFYAIAGFAGFQTFGTVADGMILKNYSKDDLLMNVARVGMGFSIVASFPLMFSGLREAVLGLCQTNIFPRASHVFDLVWVQDVISMIMLAIITMLSSVLLDAGVVVGVVGSLCGCTIIYIIPCTLYAEAIKSVLSDKEHFWELAWLRALTGVGAALAVVGCLAALGVI